MPHLTEFCLFAAAFIAAFAYGEAFVERLSASRVGAVARRLIRRRRKPGGHRRS